jgi:cytochrome c553
MYTSSKHGIIWQTDATGTRAPTCQTCHMNGMNHEVRTAWGFLALRLPTKENVLKLIDVAPALKDNLTKLAANLPSGNYVDVDDDPQWVLDRAAILQAAGILDGNLQLTGRAVEALQADLTRGPEAFNKERARMKQICSNCHAKAYAEDFFKASDDIVKKVDARFAVGVRAVQGLYKDGIIPKPAKWDYGPDLLHYYDAKTSIELELFMIVLEYKQRAFQGAFHASNDYMHWYGWAPLNKAVNEILEKEQKMRLDYAAKKKLGL